MSFSPDVLTLKNVSATYSEDSLGGRMVLTDVDFSLKHEAGMAVLTGPNGSGKTTILRVITGELPVASGNVFLAGREISSEPTHKRSGLGCLFQRAMDGMCGSLTVEENICLMLTNGPPSPVRPLVCEKRRKQLLTRAAEIAGPVGRQDGVLKKLANHFGKYPNEFSGGEAQQLCLLALMVQEPGPVLVLADEPTLNLDKSNRELCLEMLVKLAKKTTVLVATHDRDLIGLAHCVMKVEEGRIAGND